MSSVTQKAFSKQTAQETFNEKEKLSIQQKLEKQLGPEFVSTRPGAGGVRVSYIEGWKAVNLANSIFGFNGWSSEVRNLFVDFLDEKNGRFNVGITAIVRVILKDGSYHEDIGYGSIENARSKAAAFDKAKKEAVTDGMKRALRSFGNAMGNCLYDKEYLKKIAGVKCAPPDFDESNLMRYSDNAPATRSNTAPVHPIQHSQRENFQQPIQKLAPQLQQPGRYPLPQAHRSSPVPSRIIPEKNAIETPSVITRTRQYEEDNDIFDDSLNFSDEINLESEDFNDEFNQLLDQKANKENQSQSGLQQSQQLTSQTKTNQGTNQSEQVETNHPSHTNDTELTTDESRAQISIKEVVSADQLEPSEIPEQIGFFKARVAEQVQSNNVSSNDIFNPQFISPSMKRTVDQSKSTPIKRAQSSGSSSKSIRYDNPRMIQSRQIGKPRYPPPKRSKPSVDES
ncbi:hypothetical protein WICMUC_005710 [Wickerhamomyces mucosus]|uniref:DNA repair and recombination protein RAD52 n=1 Tax=Wickerhamomyces mucosus TaxID=1378264 RepID=A0A9P8P6Y1_9ASCO|nr:hypothetical protein WICMUC_005710 [Wickerhamomyces mucosus]